jgi:hypothetical protein
MLQNKKHLELLSYINTPMSRESILLLFTSHNIKYEKCELYNDFIQSLIVLIFDTYMGDDITNSVEQKNHFKWCWEKNVSNFKTEGIYIDGQKLYKHFLSFMVELYYSASNKVENRIIHDNMFRYWDYIFDYNNTKSKSDMDKLIEIYKLFEASNMSK